MAWVSPKVYAILKSSEEGKDILEGIGDKDQAEVDKEVDEFFSKSGKSKPIDNVEDDDSDHKNTVTYSTQTQDRYSGGGYDGQSMSNRAREAYDNGEMPLSKWNKEEIVSAIEDYASENNLNLDMDKIKSLKLETLKNSFLTKTSWHHTGKFFNKTDFYSLDEDYLDELSPENLDGLVVESKKTKKQKEEEHERRESERYKKAEKEANDTIEHWDEIMKNKLEEYKDDGGKTFQSWAKEITSRKKPIKEDGLFGPHIDKELFDYSNTARYERGRKPTPQAFQDGLQNWFKKGEKRQIMNNEWGYALKNPQMQEWDGTKWVDIED